MAFNTTVEVPKMEKKIQSLQTQLAEANKRVEKLREWINSMQHNGHDKDCHIFYMPKEICTRGLDELLNKTGEV